MIPMCLIAIMTHLIKKNTTGSYMYLKSVLLSLIVSFTQGFYLSELGREEEKKSFDFGREKKHRFCWHWVLLAIKGAFFLFALITYFQRRLGYFISSVETIYLF